jgi:phytoene dehydrogenase-like protein
MPDVIIVGAGLAGLCCARELQQAGVAPLVLEAADAVGGRVRTDAVGGFLLDRGFQVLLTAYPEAGRVLDYRALDLGAFRSGALVRHEEGFTEFADPFRHPLRALGSLDAPPGTFVDRLRVLQVRARACSGSLDSVFERPERSTLDHLRAAGFSAAFIDGFFRPFLGGIFLERQLETSSRMFEFVFRMFAEGDAALPAAGMGAIPAHLASGLQPGTVRLGTPVAGVSATKVQLESGERIEAAAVVVAADGPAAARLLGEAGPGSRHVACLYYAADEAPTRERLLVLDGTESGPVNNCAVISNVRPSYAPPGQHLVSASVLDPAVRDTLEPSVRAQLRDWWGPGVDGWRHLRTYRIAHALPARGDGRLDPVALPATHPSGVFTAGDWRDIPSIQGAMVSGRRTAEAVLASLTR